MKYNLFNVNLYFKDDLIEFAELKADEIGVLVQIRNLIFTYQGPIKKDIKSIGKKCNTNEPKTARIINELINRGCLYYTNDNRIGRSKCDDELKAVEERRKKSSKGGQKSAKTRTDNQQKQQLDIKSPGKGTSTNTESTPTHIRKSDLDYGFQGAFKDGSETEYFTIGSVLSDDALEKAKQNAPQWDIIKLMSEYDVWINSGKAQAPDYPDKAFPAWVFSITNGKPPP